MAAHTEAVAGALQYLEQHGLGATRWRREDEEREVIGTSGFSGAVFTHGVNRNLDPHLHSHVVVVNAVHGADGRWSACDGRGLDAHRAAAGGVYEAHLRYGLTATLGVRWEAATGPGRTSEIAGVSPAVMGEFSSRGADVRMHTFSAGARSARGRHVAWAATRPPKMTGTPYDELVVEWRRRAGFAGPELERDIFVPLRAPGPDSASVSGSYDEHRFAGVIALTPHGGAHRRDVVGGLRGLGPRRRAGGVARPGDRSVGARAAAGCRRDADGPAIRGAGEPPPAGARSATGRSGGPRDVVDGGADDRRVSGAVGNRAGGRTARQRSHRCRRCRRPDWRTTCAWHVSSTRRGCGLDGALRPRWSSDWTGDRPDLFPLNGPGLVAPSRRRRGIAPVQPDRATASTHGPGSGRPQ